MSEEVFDLDHGPCPEGCTGCRACRNVTTERFERVETEAPYAPDPNLGGRMPGFSRHYTFATLEIPQSVFDLIAKKLSGSGYGHAFMHKGMLDMSGVALSANPALPDTEWKLSSDKAAVVGGMEYLPMASCPRNAKVVLLGPGDVADLGTWDGKDTQWQGWYPLPRKPKDWVSPYWTAGALASLTDPPNPT